MTTTNEKNTATLIHLSALAQYIIPFGNYIFPTMIWSAKKNESEFIDFNGKQVLNFQLSILIYTITLCLIAVPIIIYIALKNMTIDNNFDSDNFHFGRLFEGENSAWAIIGFTAVLILIFIKITEFVLIINAAVKSSNGESYKYPLCIPFFK